MVPKRLEVLHNFFECGPQPSVGLYLVGFQLGTFVEGNMPFSRPEKTRDLLKHEIMRTCLFYNPDKLINCVSPVVAKSISRSGRCEGLARWGAGDNRGLADPEGG